MKIAILGAGVAGVSTAIALKQAGFDVSIYERHPSASNIGAGIVVWPNAAYVLEQLGVLDEIQAASGAPSQMRRLSSRNENLGSIDIQQINRQMGYTSRSILRSDFQRILLTKLATLGVEVHYAHPITRIKTTASGQAEVEFQDGSTTSADVMIGADGRMASYARQYVHGSNTPVYQGFINWIGVYESEAESLAEIAVTDYWGVGARFGIVPINQHQAYWAGGVACPQVGQKNPSQYKAELAAIFADWPQPVQAMIRQTPLARINKVYVHDHEPMRTWHKHNLLVIGDAAHAPLPTSGQGACQALEDAWHLANVLSQNSHDLQHAFSQFTEIRFKKTTGIIMAARSFAASLFNPDPEFCFARNELSKNTDFTQVATAMAQGWSQYLPLTNRSAL